MKELSVSDHVLIQIYGQYNGRELLKMGKKLFSDLAPAHLASDVLWEHLYNLHSGQLLLQVLRL